MTTDRADVPALGDGTSPAGPPAAGRKLPSLTGIRWWAAFAVVLVHALVGVIPIPEGVLTEPVAAMANVLGYVGVSCFFVLSGFVLTWSMRDGDSAPKFWRRRFVKIYPNHLVTTAVALAPLLLAGTPVTGLMPNLLLVHAWTTDPAVTFGLNGVSWSLSCEALFYLAFPVLAVLITKIPANQVWFWVGTTVAAVLLVPQLATVLPEGPPLPWDPSPSYHFWFVYVFPVTRLLEFVIGILLARIVMSGRWLPIRPWHAWLTLAACCAAAVYLPVLYQVAAATVIPLALLIAATAQNDLDGRTELLGSRVMVWLGNISFALYLVHGLVFLHVARAFGANFAWTLPTAALAIAIAFTVSVLLSWLLFKGVELPVQRHFSAKRSRTS